MSAQNVSEKRCEVKWSEIHDFIDSRVRDSGIDFDREIHTHSMFGDDGLTLVYIQLENAPLTAEAAQRLEESKKINARPSYLRSL